MPLKKMIVVTGGAGYLGSVLIPILVARGYYVRVIDRFFFGRETLSDVDPTRIECIEADTRWYPAELLDGAYAIIDLAALSNDPAGELDRTRTMDINFHARVRTATLAKQLGVKRYILASSCSVYGFNDNMVDETSETNPITTYAEASLLAEQGVLPLNTDDFTVTALRQGTLYGLSPRMRFDLVVNMMTQSLFRDGIITVRGGQQWRPLVHVADSAQVFADVLEADTDTIGGHVFNVGATEHNFTVEHIAELVHAGASMHGTIVHEKTAVDTRSYRVSCDLLKRTLHFAPRHTPESAAREIAQALRSGAFPDMSRTRTIDWYKSLLVRDPEILDRPFLTARHLSSVEGLSLSKKSNVT
jgi:nucleoside-diphosphate-sugar epimerase